MSEYEWDDDDLETSNDSNAMKELRKAYKKLQAEKKELSEMLEGMQSSLRERSVKDVLASKGLPEKIAAFIPKDAATSEEVEAWISEYGDVFGVQAGEAEQPAQQSQVNPELAALNRIASTQQSGETYSGDPDQLDALIRAATTPEELNRILFGNAMGPQAI